MKKKRNRVIFRAVDGSLIMDRKSDYLFETCFGRYADRTFLDHSMNIDAREKGVNIVKYIVSPEKDLVEVTVEYRK